MNEKNNVVEVIKIGNTNIKICDDYCRDKSDDDIERILKKTANNALCSLSAAADAQTAVKCKEPDI